MSAGTDKQSESTYLEKPMHIHSLTYTSTVAIAQLRCGRHEDCDDVRERRCLRLLQGSFLMLHLTFTLGSCGLWLVLSQMIQPAEQNGNYSDGQLGTTDVWGLCVHRLY